MIDLFWNYINEIRLGLGLLTIGCAYMWARAVSAELRDINSYIAEINDCEFIAMKRVYNVLDAKYPGWREQFPKMTNEQLEKFDEQDGVL